MIFKNAIAVVGWFQPPTTLENIIIAVGINHRGLSFTKTTQTDMNKLQRVLEIHSTKNSFMTGVSTGSNLTTEEALKIKLINDKIKTDYGKRFILPLASSQGNIAKSDILHKIHHTQETVDKVILQLTLFVDNIRLN